MFFAFFLFSKKSEQRKRRERFRRQVSSPEAAPAAASFFLRRCRRRGFSLGPGRPGARGSPPEPAFERKVFEGKKREKKEKEKQTHPLFALEKVRHLALRMCRLALRDAEGEFEGVSL